MQQTSKASSDKNIREELKRSAKEYLLEEEKLYLADSYKYRYNRGSEPGPKMNYEEGNSDEIYRTNKNMIGS